MTNALYDSFKSKLMAAGINLSTDTIKVALLKNTYTPALDTEVFFGDINSNEASGAGYTAGGVALASKAITIDATNHRAYLDATDTEWDTSTITARYAVLYKDTGSPSTAPLIGYITFLDGSGNPVDKITNGDTFYIQWALPANGAILYLT